MRTYGDAVDVRPARPLEGRPDAAADEPVEPGQFLWRGRLYVVRAVLAHWVELGPWWTSPSGAAGAARPARPGRPARAPVRQPGPGPDGPDRASVDAWRGTRATAARAAVGEPEPVPALAEEPRSVARDVGAVEREVWRVEARAGRSSSVGVYDLVRDVWDVRDAPPAGSGRRTRWRLARALD